MPRKARLSKQCFAGVLRDMYFKKNLSELAMLVQKYSFKYKQIAKLCVI